ncbi:ADP-ribosylglycohydrolase family protein [Streptomyces albulus]|nr:ADP-ribosylglycohydrolase family protein [Streptomyces noursei]
MPFTLWAAARNLRNFEQAFWTTARAGGDVDTTCGIVGGIVAASPVAPRPGNGSTAPSRSPPGPPPSDRRRTACPPAPSAPPPNEPCRRVTSPTAPACRTPARPPEPTRRGALRPAASGPPGGPVGASFGSDADGRAE